MGVYLPYVNMPTNRVECPLNYGGTCLISFSKKSNTCIGVNCGRIMPPPNKINKQRINSSLKFKEN